MNSAYRRCINHLTALGYSEYSTGDQWVPGNFWYDKLDDNLKICGGGVITIHEDQSSKHVHYYGKQVLYDYYKLIVNDALNRASYFSPQKEPDAKPSPNQLRELAHWIHYRLSIREKAMDELHRRVMERELSDSESQIKTEETKEEGNPEY